MALQAQDQASGEASASVVRLLSTAQQRELAFGAITVSQQAGGAVAVAADGAAASFSGAVRPACGAAGGCATHPALFRVRGEAGHGYRILLPAQVVARGRLAGQQLVVTNLAARSSSLPGASNAGRLDHTGADQFRVGGTLLVPAGTAADYYAADLPVNVTYE